MSITSRINEMSTHIEQAYDELQGLGADLTNVNKNIENISMVLDDIYDSMPQVSGEGTSLTLDDTRVGKIKSTLKGNTSQDGTPTPTSPIPVNVVSGDNEINVVGKNLFTLRNVSNGTFLGIERTINNSLLKLNGTSTGAGSVIGRQTTGIVLPSGTYNIFISKSNGVITPNGKQMVFYFRKSNGTELSAFNVNSFQDSTYSFKYTITLNENTEIYVEVYCNGTDYIVNNLELQFQIEKGTTATTYEPYQGNTYNIDLPVENLFNDSTLNNKWVAQNGTITSATDANCIKYNCNTNDTYTLSATFGTSSPNNIIVMAFYNSSDTLLNRYVATINTSLTMTYTAPANTSYMYAGHYGIVPTTIQLEKGSKQNSFTPYGTTPIELCSSPDGTKRDYFLHDKTNDKWYWHREIGKVVLNGTQTINSLDTSSTNTVRIVYYNGVPNGASPIAIMSNRLVLNTNIWNVDQNGVSYNATNYSLFMRLSKTLVGTTEASINTYLSSNNIDIYYPLSTPTDTEITYQPLIDQLNLLEQAMSKDGQTNISQVNNDLPFIISASALKEWQENTSLNSTLSMVNPLSLGNTLNTQENDTQPIEVDNIEPLEEEENEES